MNIESQIFTGAPEQVQQQMADFFKKNVIKIHAFAQSQSSGADGVVIVTATLLYVKYQTENKHVLGFNK